MHHERKGPRLHGIVAEFDDPDALLKAAQTAYREGYRKLDAYSPFPVHGLSEAIGFKKTAVPFFTLAAGLTGAATGFGMQYIACVLHYPYEVGGRPYFSWPAFIPITFELMVLFASFTAGLTMLALNGLPQPYHPIFNARNFDRASSDRFFLCIEADDPQFDDTTTRRFLEGMSPRPLLVSEVNA